MKPKEWGPFVWYLIHSIMYFIPDDEYFIKNKYFYFNFIKALNSIIPCPICRSHFKKILKKDDLKYCNNKNDIIIWSIDKHNLVNKDLKKKILKREEIDSLYNNINFKKFFYGLDILIFNNQQKIPLKQYIIVFNSLRIILPNQKLKIKYNEGFNKYNINFRNHKDVINWYKNIGNYIIDN